MFGQLRSGILLKPASYTVGHEPSQLGEAHRRLLDENNERQIAVCDIWASSTCNNRTSSTQFGAGCLVGIGPEQHSHLSYGHLKFLTLVRILSQAIFGVLGRDNASLTLSCSVT